MTHTEDVARATRETAIQRHGRYVAELQKARRQRDNAILARSKARGTGAADPVLERAAWLAEIEVELCLASVIVSWGEVMDTVVVLQ